MPKLFGFKFDGGESNKNTKVVSPIISNDEDKSNYLKEILEHSHVKHFKSTWSVESFINRCKMTAGIQLGRTTIEGWLCGKPGWIYKVDSSGGILSSELFEPPVDIEKYHAEKVAKRIKEIRQEKNINH